MQLSDINLCDLNNFKEGCPHEMFAFLRKEAPVWFHPPTPLAPGGEGFWVISKHEDARAILKDHENFSSETGRGARTGGGTTLEDMSTDMAPGLVLSMMDPPKHDDIRALVNQGFFPRTLKVLEDDLNRRVTRILDSVEDLAEYDFVEKIASELPLQAICSMGGVPDEDRYKIFGWANAAIEYAGRSPDDPAEQLIARMYEMGEYAYNLIQKSRANPGDDLMSQVIHAEIPGEDGQPRKLDDLELIRFFNLLITGGSETTLNAIAHGFYALLQQPEQYKLLQAQLDELLPSALEEFLRWSSPVHFNRRTASNDVNYKDQQIKRGDKVTIWYPSANRDEDVFKNADHFDITRSPNPQIAFGQGIHHCLGANLARLEMKLMFQQLLPRLANKNVTTLDNLKFVRSNRHQSVHEMLIRVLPK